MPSCDTTGPQCVLRIDFEAEEEAEPEASDPTAGPSRRPPVPMATGASLRSGFLVGGDGVAPCDHMPQPPCMPGVAPVVAVLKARKSVPGDSCAHGPDSSPPGCSPARCGPTQRQPPGQWWGHPLAAHGHEGFSRNDRTDHSRPAVELPGTRTQEKAEGGFTGPQGLSPGSARCPPFLQSHEATRRRSHRGARTTDRLHHAEPGGIAALQTAPRGSGCGLHGRTGH